MSDHAIAVLERLSRRAWRPRVDPSFEGPADGAAEPVVVLDLTRVPLECALPREGFLWLRQGPSVSAGISESAPVEMDGLVGRWWGRPIVGFEPFADRPLIDEFVAEDDEEIAAVLAALGAQSPTLEDKLLGFSLDLDDARLASGQPLAAARCPDCGAPMASLILQATGVSTLPSVTCDWGQGTGLVLACPAHAHRIVGAARASW
ncbi:MAG: hypothetical protein WCJ30_18620 [Deltaproteobacteria bacterium]